MKLEELKERIFQYVFLLSACASILAILLICFFLFSGGLPAMGEIGISDFLLGKQWKPGNDIYGILPMILGSIYVTLGAIILGVPVGVFSAVYLAKYSGKTVAKIVRPMIDLLAGIPSVVYGFAGLVILVPFVKNVFKARGPSMLTASILLAIMILPTIISVSEAAIRAVPESYYEGSLALGATHTQSVYFAVLPAAKSGILAGIILGIGRAIGETMAVVMVAGNQARMPKGLLEGVRTLTTNIVIEMGYAADLHRQALIATGVVLFVFILLINLAFALLKRRTTK